MSPNAAPPVSLLQLPTPDGRSLDVYHAGPRDGTALLFHVGTPGAPIPYPPALAQMADRGLRYDDQGHLSLAVDHFGDILDELIEAGAADDAHE